MTKTHDTNFNVLHRETEVREACLHAHRYANQKTIAYTLVGVRTDPGLVLKNVVSCSCGFIISTEDLCSNIMLPFRTNHLHHHDDYYYY